MDECILEVSKIFTDDECITGDFHSRQKRTGLLFHEYSHKILFLKMV